MPRPKFMEEKGKDPKDLPETDPKDEKSFDFRHPDIISGAEYADEIEGDDEDDDEIDDPKLDPDPDKDDDNDEGDFEGLEASNASDTDIRAELKLLREQIAAGKPNETTKLRNMTKEQLENLGKENPLALMTLMVEHVLEEKGVTAGAAEVRKTVATEMDHSTAVQKARLAIATRFDPKSNPKLQKAAMAIYLDRKSRGITIEKDPRAELDAFIIAADEHPELLSNSHRRGNPRKQSSSARGGGESTPSLTREQRAIARNWDIDLNDKKGVRRIAEISRRYTRLDNSRPRRGGR